MKNNYDDNEILVRYVKDLSKYPILDEETQRELVVKAQKGDEEARNQLAVSNFRFVIDIAKRYKNSGFSLSELIAEGNLGLFEAINKFDSNRQNSFVSYAAWWIRDSIVRMIQQHGNMVRIPVNKTRTLSQIRQIEDSLYQKDKDSRSNKDKIIAEHLNMNEHSVVGLKTMVQGVDSLDQEIEFSDDGRVSRRDIVEDPNAPLPEDHMVYVEELEMLHYCLSKIPPREADVIKKRYGIRSEKMSLSQLSKEYGLTKERIRQIEIKGVSRMKSIANTMGMDMNIAA